MRTWPLLCRPGGGGMRIWPVPGRPGGGGMRTWPGGVGIGAWPDGMGMRAEACVTERLVPGRRGSQSGSPSSGEQVDGLAEALAAFPTGVTLVMVADGRDDIGTTVSAFCPVSLMPPLVLVSLIAGSYPAEVIGRVDRFAVTMLAAGQRALAGRFAVAGRPGARLLLDGVPHHRGPESGALIPDGGMAALECEAVQRIPAGDHLLVIASVLRVPYVAESGEPLIRFAGRYPSLH